MPEVRRGFQKFHTNLRLALNRGSNIHNFAILNFGVGDAFQLKLLALGDLGRQCNQGSVRVHDQRFRLFGELPFWSLTCHRHRHAEDDTLAAAPVGVWAGGRPGTHEFQRRRGDALAQ